MSEDRNRHADVLRRVAALCAASRDDATVVVPRPPAPAEVLAALAAGAEALEAPAPKVLAKAWAIFGKDGEGLAEDDDGLGPVVYHDREGAEFHSVEGERPVHVLIVEAPASPAVPS